MKVEQVENYIINPVLDACAQIEPRMRSNSIKQLLLGTMAQESAFGLYSRQVGGGPALGPFQIEPATEKWLREDYLARKPKLKNIASLLLHDAPRDDEYYNVQLETNWRYGAFMARIRYWVVPDPLPDQLEGWAEYWDKHYNANPNHGFPEDFIKAYNKYVMNMS